MKPARKPAPRPDPIIYDLLALPVLNKTAESIRDELRAYLDYMAKAGRKPPQLTLKPEQYDALLRAANAKIDKVAPPLRRPELSRAAHRGAGQGRAGACVLN